VVRNRYSAPSGPAEGGGSTKRSWTKRVVLSTLAAIFLLIVGFVVNEWWRARTLLAFCKVAQPKVSLDELLVLEKKYWIDDSYLVQAGFEGYIDQRHSHDLEFRSHMMDPDFACAITHDGRVVESVQLLTLEGFDPG
jgi:hypothetical protein